MKKAAEESLMKTESQELMKPLPKPTWDDIGDQFETMGKIGVALAVGFSAAGLFCKLAHQGRVKIPSMTSLLLNAHAEPSKKSSKRVAPQA